nr:AAA family ATPase [uncultured Vibrio sp.]
MIKKFGFRNFSSFREGTEISFEYDGNTPISVTKGELVGTTIGIKGANGSGKTNILKALTFLYCLVTKRMSTTLKDPETDEESVRLPIESFFFSKEPSEFYIELLCDNVLYYYELDVTKDGIVREFLVRNKTSGKGKDEILVEREGNQITNIFPDYNELLNVKLKEDQSIISIPSDFNFHNEMKDLKNLYDNFSRVIFNVGPYGIKNESENHIVDSRATFYKKNERALEFAKAVISSGDEGISDIEIETMKSTTGKDIDYPVFIHEYDGKKMPLIYEDESMGTKVLFKNLFKYWFILEIGGLLIFDEFDTHLHSMILPEILDLFINPETNPKNAQLIITAHNTEIIDSLGRYRTILVNKDKNESYCYRLDAVSMLRNDRPISPFYQKGKIGGVPKSVSGLSSRIVNNSSETDNG